MEQQFRNHETIATTVPMRIVLEAQAVPLPCTLSYTVFDPFAVTATFASSDGEVSWTFSRELLAAGLQHQVGLGDVVVRPLVGALVEIVLSSPHGAAVVHADLADLAGFVSATYELLPEGSEWQYLNFDAELAALLDDGAA
jgi:hypothetical protein